MLELSLLALAVLLMLTSRWTAAYLLPCCMFIVAAAAGIRSGLVEHSWTAAGIGLAVALPAAGLAAAWPRWVLPLFTGLAPACYLVLFYMAGVLNTQPVWFFGTLLAGWGMAFLLPWPAASLAGPVAAGIMGIVLFTPGLDMLDPAVLGWASLIMLAGFLIQILVLPRLEAKTKGEYCRPDHPLRRRLDPAVAFPRRTRRLAAGALVVVLAAILLHSSLMVSPSFKPAAPDPARRLRGSLPETGLVLGQKNRRYLAGRLQSGYIAAQGEISRLRLLLTGLPVLDPAILQLRPVKNDAEIVRLERACQLTASSLRQALPLVRPGTSEAGLQQKLLEGFSPAPGVSPAAGFPSIVATGRNALILHYSLARSVIQPGELVLFDIGAEFEGYSADLSRTLPADGVFTPEQRKLYEAVLEAQLAALSAVREGAASKDLGRIATERLKVRGLDKYFTHGLSHHAGLDVHDPSPRGDGKLMAGMVITIEPGVYLPEKGIGIRIEDTVLVTKDGCRILTDGFPKDPDEIERLMARSPASQSGGSSR